MDFAFRAIRFMTPKYRECVAFYRDVLEFPLQWGNESTCIADFVIDGVKMAVCDAGPGKVDQSDRVVLVLRVGDVEEAYQTLCRKGVRFVIEPTDFPELHVRAARFRDPSGNLIEINVRLS